MKSLATLYVTRKKVYALAHDDLDTDSMECATHPWAAWSDCSTVCGTGTQTRWRAYKEPRLAQNFNCNQVLNQTQACVGTLCGIQDNTGYNAQPSAECELSRWSQWSECSNNCGKGYATRTRAYLNSYAKDKCQRQVPMQLEQTRNCMGENCGGSISNKYDNNDEEQSSPFETTVEEETNLEEEKNDNFETERDNFNNNDFNRERNRRPNLQSENAFDERNTFGRNRNTLSRYPNYDNEQTYQLPPTERLHGNTRGSGGRRVGFNEYERNPALNQDDSSDPYNVVQEFCLEMPEISNEPCNQRPVAYQNYWFYDANDFMCKLFTTNNCDTNRNKFKKLGNCESTCQNPHLQSQGYRLIVFSKSQVQFERHNSSPDMPTIQSGDGSILDANESR